MPGQGGHGVGTGAGPHGGHHGECAGVEAGQRVRSLGPRGNPPITGSLRSIVTSRSVYKDSVTLIPWRDITASVRRALALAAILGLLLTGTESSALAVKVKT